VSGLLGRARRSAVVLASGGAFAGALFGAPAGGAEWTTGGGDAQRTAAVRSDMLLTKEAVQEGQFRFLWKMKLDNESREGNSLTEPILLDRLIGYRGFKALAFVGGSADRVISVDTDLARPYFTTHVTYAAATGGRQAPSRDCPGGLVATPSRRTPLLVSAFDEESWEGAAARSSVGQPGKGAAVLAERLRATGDVAPKPTPTPTTPSKVPPIPFGGVDPLYVMGSDGLLRTLRVSDGALTAPMVPFLPPSARPSALTFIDGVVYTSTSHGCGSTPNGVWALDLTANNTVTTWPTGSAHVAGTAGPTFGADGTLYVAMSADSAKPPSPQANRVVALDPATLQPKDWLATDAADFNASPVVFKHKDRELLAGSGNDGRLYLLDTASLGGADHKTPLHVTEKYTSGRSASGLATWEDEAGTRWIVASAAGGEAPGPKFAANGPAPEGSIVAFKLVDTGDRPTLAPAWRSPNLLSPLAPVVVSGMVLAVSVGEHRTAPATDAAPRPRSVPARLYVLDGALGKSLWHSGSTITSRARARMAAGAGQVYLVTDDSQLYAFGIPMEH